MNFSFSFGKSEAAPARRFPTGREVMKPAAIEPGHAEIIRSMNRKMVRMYDASVTTNLNQDFPISISSANAEILVSIIAARSRARRLERDNPYAWSILNTFQNNVCGDDPFRLEMKVGEWTSSPGGGQTFEEDSETNRQIEEAWHDAGMPENCTVRRDMSRAEVYWQAITAMIRDGGILARHWRAFPNNKFNYAIETIETDRLDSNWNRPAQGSNNEIQFSIEMDQWHAPVAYWILTRHPGDVFAWTIGDKYRERVKAEDVIGFFGIRTRAGQYVAMPRFSSIIQRMHRDDQFDIAHVTAAIWASCKPFFIINKNTANEYTGDAESPTGAKVKNVEPGTGEILPPGYEPNLVDPKFPIEAASGFKKDNIRAEASGSGLAYHTISSDLEGVNFSSGRLGENAQRDEFKKLQKHMILNFVRPHFNEWLKYAILSGQLKLPISRLEELQKAAHFHGRRWSYINPIQDTQADILRIEAGLTSRSRIIAESERGGDVEQVDAEIAHDRDTDETHELDFSGADPTLPTLKQPPGTELPNPENSPAKPAPVSQGKQTIKKSRRFKIGRDHPFMQNGHEK